MRFGKEWFVVLALTGSVLWYVTSQEKACVQDLKDAGFNGNDVIQVCKYAEVKQQ